MKEQDYRRLMTTLCDVVGLDSVTETVASQHLVINGTAVGVIFDEAISPTRIFIYIDLGPIPDADASQLHRTMLANNVKADSSITGHFGIHPKTGNAVFHIRMRFSQELTGDELARLLRHQVMLHQDWIARYTARYPASAIDRDPIRSVRASTAGRLSLNRQSRFE